MQIMRGSTNRPNQSLGAGTGAMYRSAAQRCERITLQPSRERGRRITIGSFGPTLTSADDDHDGLVAQQRARQHHLQEHRGCSGPRFGNLCRPRHSISQRNFIN